MSAVDDEMLEKLSVVLGVLEEAGISWNALSDRN
jgi:hypothetical protein